MLNTQHKLTVDERSHQAIYALLTKIQDAWATGNAKQLSDAFSEDGIFVPFNGSRLNGRSEIFEFHKRPFATELRGAKLKIDVVDIRVLADKTFLVSTNGGPVRAGEAHCALEAQSFVIQEQGDKWVIVSFQNTPTLPPRKH